MRNGLHILFNIIRTFVLLALLFAIAFALVFGGALLFETWRDPYADLDQLLAQATVHFTWLVPYVAMACLAWIGIALILSGTMIRMASGCRIITPGSLPRIERILERLCLKAEMPVPKLGVIEMDEMNAFASGLFGDYTVAVSEGLVRRLDDAEIEAVIAHELTHIKNHDVMLMVIAGTVTGGFALLAELMLLAIVRGVGLIFGLSEDDAGEGISGFAALAIGSVFAILAAFVSTLVGFAISRTREYLADAGAAKLTGNPGALISALQKITGDCDIGAPSGVMQMCIDQPRSFIDLLSTHPRTEDRIAALRTMPGAARAVMAGNSGQAPMRMRGGMKVPASFGRRTA